MKQQQRLKEILESIEVGLYDKWEANLMNPEKAKQEDFPIPESVEQFIANHPETDFILDAFYWAGTPEGVDYWFEIAFKHEKIIYS
jgi:hypothetical protein